jgi:hypothetical protein
MTASPLTMASQLSWCTGVRRRHVGGRDFLVRITSIHPLDAVSAALWDLVDNERTLFEICQAIEKSRIRISGYQGIESTVYAAMALQKLGYLEYTDAGQADYEKQYISSSIKHSICDLMQSFYAHQSDWQQHLSSTEIDKIYQRFTQIFYEYEVAQIKNTGSEIPTKDDFVTDLAIRYNLDEKQCSEWLRTQFEIRTWRYDMQENRIVIVYMNTVYSGDLDNRL